jgi:hypothetical protein
MQVNRAKRIYRPSPSGSLRQCEILSGVSQIVPTDVQFVKVESSPLNPDGSALSSENSQVNQVAVDAHIKVLLHDYVIVVTQDCDLDWDYRERVKPEGDRNSGKMLNSISFCEVYTAQTIRVDSTRIKNTGEWKKVPKNQNERYHFFERIHPECDYQSLGIPELTSDFKQVFSVHADYVYDQLAKGFIKRRTMLFSPYLEHFSSRFYRWHSRIGLPFQFQSE